MLIKTTNCLSLFLIISALLLGFCTDLECAYSISGTVKDISGNEPIQGAAVTVRNADTLDTVATRTTDASGNYSASNIPSAGSYDILVVTKQGYSMISPPSPPYQVTDASPTVTADTVFLSLDNPSQPATPTNAAGGGGGGGGGGGCFIATAAFGSYFDPYVKVLRNFRDIFLLTTRPGQAFVERYYRVSPPIADFIAKSEGLKASVRIALLPAVGFSALSLQIGVFWTLILSAAALVLTGVALRKASTLIQRKV